MAGSLLLAAVLAAAHVTLHAAPAPCPTAGGPPAVPTASPQAGRDAPVHINTATADDLRRLPGIGPRKAERILAARERGPFRRAQDLRRVPGFGAKTIQRLAPRLVFD